MCESKKCSKCGKVKCLDDFNYGGYKGSKKAHCRECDKMIYLGLPLRPYCCEKCGVDFHHRSRRKFCTDCMPPRIWNDKNSDSQLCRHCKVVKNLSDFHKDSNAASGHCKNCKECRKIIAKSRIHTYTCLRCGKEFENHCARKYCHSCPSNLGPSKWAFVTKCNEINEGLALFYLVEFTGHGEIFYKVGLTGQGSVKVRYNCKKQMPYEHKILFQFEGSADLLWELESSIKLAINDIRYNPEMTKNVSNECFVHTQENLDLVLRLITKKINLIK